ncbi:hypothetical protein T492DRAFT_267893 [Pavlovales sp. CCMP2436]|nr:hypothetical protein T492DRAFT_267893 [Pavlovales sp. CCMP2436]
MPDSPMTASSKSRVVALSLNLLKCTNRTSSGGWMPSGFGVECCVYQIKTSRVTSRKYCRAVPARSGSDSCGVMSVSHSSSPVCRSVGRPSPPRRCSRSPRSPLRSVRLDAPRRGRLVDQRGTRLSRAAPAARAGGNRALMTASMLTPTASMPSLSTTVVNSPARLPSSPGRLSKTSVSPLMRLSTTSESWLVPTIAKGAGSTSCAHSAVILIL